MITVKDLLAQKTQRAIYHVVVSDTVQKVLEMMREHTIRAVVVLDDAGHLIGIVSERDCALKVLLKGLRAVDTVVNDIMTADVFTVSATTRTRDCMALMSAKKIRHLPVLDGDRVLGMISIRDLMDDIIADHESTIASLHSYIHS